MFLLFEVVINESTFLLSKQRAVHCIFNENEHRTHTLTSNVWLSGFQIFVLFEVVINKPTFPLSHTPTNNVRYIAFSMSFNENKPRTHTYNKF